MKKTVFITNIVFRDFGEYSFQHEGKIMFIYMTFFILSTLNWFLRRHLMDAFSEFLQGRVWLE